MNLPNIPTDNLYKFIALSGVFIFIFSIFITLTKNHDLMLEAYNADLSVSKLELKTNHLNQDMEIFKKEIQLKSGTEQKLEITAKERNKLNQLTEEFRSQQDQLLEANNTKNILYENAENLRLILVFSKIGIAMGLVLMFLGFGLWYYKLQRFLDLKVKQERRSKTRKKKNYTLKKIINFFSDIRNS